jgi:hypothetical protein
MGKSIKFVVESLLKKSDNLSIDYKYDKYSAIHYLSIFPATFFNEEQNEQAVYQLAESFRYRYPQEDICIAPSNDSIFQLLENLEVKETFTSVQKVSFIEKLQESITPILSQIFAPQYRFALGAVAAVVVLLGTYSLLPNTPIDNGGGFISSNENSIKYNQSLLALQEELTTSNSTIESQEQQIKEKKEQIIQDAKMVADAKLIESRMQDNGTFGTAFNDLVKPTDLNENISFKSKNETITLQNLQVNNLITTFSAQKGSQTHMGQFNFEYDIVTIQSIGTGRFYKNPEGKIILQLLKESGTIRTWTAL